MLGNWERRAELAKIRHAESKDKKALRNDKTIINKESVLHKLQRDILLLQSGARCNVWLSMSNEILVCKCYMRTEDCRLKKCKSRHDSVTVSHLKNIHYNGEEHEEESGCDPCLPISEIATKDSNRLMFISIDNVCVYDHLNADIWHEWVLINRPPPPPLQSPTYNSHDSSGILSEGISGMTVTEKRDRSNSHHLNPKNPLAAIVGDSDEEEGEEGEEEDGDAEKKAVNNSSGSNGASPSSSSFKGNSKEGRGKNYFHSEGFDENCSSKLFSYLDNTAVVSLLTCSKMFKSLCLRDQAVRQRKKEALAVSSHDVSRRRKEEKRKKAKNACISKNDKRDEFARGATIR